MPATELFRLRTSLRLLQDRNDLFFGESFALHGLLLMKQTLLPFRTNLGCQVASIQHVDDAQDSPSINSSFEELNSRRVRLVLQMDTTPYPSE
jgi:hypothetical protein